MRSDMTRYALACYFAEVINHITTENSDESDTLRLFLNALYVLANKPEIPLWQIKGAFELKLMSICGFMPDFSSCFECGCDIEISNINTFSTDF
jgi:DNA repair protein RecO (recombination protein O)